MKIKNIYFYLIIFFLLFTVSCKKETFTVSFNSNGGTSVESVNVNENELVTKPTDPIKEGYQFIGWYLNDELYNFNSKVTSNITLESKWQINTYTVSFDKDNLEEIISFKVDYNTSINKIEDPIKEGYEFIGWYLNDELYDFNSYVISDITLIAKYEKLLDKNICIGSYVANISETEYLFIEIDDNYNGYITHVVNNSSYKYNITDISSSKGCINVAYLNNNQTNYIYLNVSNDSLILSGINNDEYILTIPKTYNITYHLHDNSSVVKTVYENMLFENFKYDMSNTESLVIDGWYLNDGTIVLPNSLIKSDLDVFVNVYTDGLIFDNNEVIYYNGENKNVIIPKYFEGILIDTIYDYAFLDCMIEKVVLPDSIKVIGKSAFEGCIALNSVTVFEGLEEISERAFYLCNNLREFNLPSTLLVIGTFAFSFTSIEKVVFPYDLAYIGSYAYHACNMLEEVEFLNSVPCEIGSTVFTYTNDDYENLQIYYSNVPIYVPDGDNLPYKDYRKHVNLRDYASSIYPKSVKGKTGYIVIDDVLLGYINEGDEVFTYVDVPSGVTEIDDFAFYGCVLLEAVDMKEGFIKIGKYAFYNCISIKNLYIPSTLEEIDDYAFTGFFVGNNISRLYLPEGFKRIGDGAFLSSFNLRIVELPSTLEYIGYLAFGMGNSLERMTFKSATPPEVGEYTNDVGESFREIFSIINAGKTTIYVPFETVNNEKSIDLYKKADGFKEYESYIKAQPEGEEVGHYGDGVTFIDLDGCDRASIYSLELSENDTTDMGGTRYEYKKEEGSYVLNGFRLEMTFPSYGKVIAIYGNRSINFSLDNVTYNLKEPKRYYDSYNWTNFDLYEISPNKGNGIFEMYGSFLTPFTYEIENNVFKINIDGNNKLPENADYAGVKEYIGKYDSITDSFSVSFMLNDYYQLMEFNASYTKINYATKETSRLIGKYVAYHGSSNYAMFTLVSNGSGLVDVYIGENCYKDCSYTLENNVLKIDVQSLVVEVNMTKDGLISGNFMGVDVTFIYEDELMDSSKLPSRDDI